MRATVSYLQQKFDEFNRLCFEGQLPPVPIVLSKARTYLGVCAYKTRRDLLMRKRHYDFRFRFSVLFDLPEEVVEDTMLHEMIHYYIAYNHLKDSSTHGKLFRQMMDDLNSRFGRHITVSHRLSDEQREEVAREVAEARSRRQTYYCIAVMQFRDGRTGIKSIPHIAERIVEFHKMIMRVSGIEAVKFYVTNDPFFSRYPRSMALRAYFIDAAELSAHLQQAECYTCRANALQLQPRNS